MMTLRASWPHAHIPSPLTIQSMLFCTLSGEKDPHWMPRPAHMARMGAKCRFRSRLPLITPPHPHISISPGGTAWAVGVSLGSCHWSDTHLKVLFIFPQSSAVRVWSSLIGEGAMYAHFWLGSRFMSSLSHGMNSVVVWIWNVPHRLTQWTRVP